MREQALDVQTELLDGGVHVVHVSGRVDTVTADTLDTSLHATIEGGATQVVLDLAHVDYMASAGLRSLLVALKAMHAAGGSLLLAAVHPRVQDILKIAGLTSLFTILPTQAEAVAHLKGAK